MSELVLPLDKQILFVKNLPYSLKGEELYTLFGQYGAIRQVRLGSEKSTKGQAFVVFEEPGDARVAQQKLNGYNYHNRYLVVLFHTVQQESRSHRSTWEAKQEKQESWEEKQEPR